MSVPIVITLLFLAFFLILTINSSIKLQKTLKALQKYKKELHWHHFTEDVMSDIYAATNGPVNPSTITFLLKKHISRALSPTAIAVILITEEKLHLQIETNKSVSQSFIDKLQEEMLASLEKFDHEGFHKESVVAEVIGTVDEKTLPRIPDAVFHFPLLLHNSVVSMVTVSAIKPTVFKKDDLAAIQKTVTEVAKFISKIDGVLEEEKGKLHAMLGSLDDGLVMIDTRFTLQSINPAATQLLGIKSSQPTIMDVLSTLPIHFDFKNKLALAIHNNHMTELSKVPINNQQLRFRITPVYGTTSKTLGAVMLIHDETLTNSVPQMKEDFTNIIVHELRNPLTSIKVSSELLTSAVKFSAEEQHKLLQVIFHQSNKLLTDVQQILDAAKIEAGVFTIHRAQSDLKTVIHEVTDSFQKEAQEKMLNFHVDVDFHLPAFSFDQKYLTRALTNILANSIKFTSHGGTIHVSAKRKESNAVISIVDTGAGIPKDKQHKLFNKFSQIEEASATVGKGLGLYIVRGIIEAHGGQVVIDSDIGRGTNMTLTLPIIEPTIERTDKHKDTQRQRLLN